MIIKLSKDLDESILQFRNDNRPARRYLYFKYLMTYLTTQQSGNTQWVERSPGMGTMWCTPGSYLRHSMLRLLARQVSDHYLPEALYAGRHLTLRPRSRIDHQTTRRYQHCHWDSSQNRKSSSFDSSPDGGRFRFRRRR